MSNEQIEQRLNQVETAVDELAIVIGQKAARAESSDRIVAVETALNEVKDRVQTIEVRLRELSVRARDLALQLSP